VSEESVEGNEVGSNGCSALGQSLIYYSVMVLKQLAAFNSDKSEGDIPLSIINTHPT
jgi:hypothetical protein